MIARPDDADYERAFRDYHRREYGFDSDAEVLIDDLRVRVVGRSETLKRVRVPKAEGPLTPIDRTPTYFEGGLHDTAVYRWEQLCAGHTLAGPALLIQDGGTIVIEPQCRAEVTEFGDLEIQVEEGQRARLDTEADPIQLSIFNNLFMSIGGADGAHPAAHRRVDQHQREAGLLLRRFSTPMADWWPTLPTSPFTWER